MQGDARLIALVRDGDPGAFDTIVDRYRSRLLGFCRQMLGSTEDAEDVLQEVFVNAFRAMAADNREINLRPWLYRIARNRCLNHLRKPVADAKESMDAVPAVAAASTHERVHNREEFRQLLADVKKLPETQRGALLLREMDALSYEDIAQAMETTVPSVKSLLVRARISLAEASQARMLTCGDVRLELAEAAEGLRKASSPVRRHVRECADCGEFREQIRSDSKVLAALSPIGPLLALKSLLVSKLGFGGGGATGTSSAAGTAGAGGAAGAGGGGSVGAGAIGAGAGAGAISSGAAGGLSAFGAAIGAKAVAGVVTAAVITAGAVEIRQQASRDSAAPSVAPASTIVDSPRQVVTAKEQSATPAPEQVAPVTETAPAPPAAETVSTSAPNEPGPSVVIEEATTPAAIPHAEASVVDPLAESAAPGTDGTTPGGTATGGTSSSGVDAPGGGGTSAGSSGSQSGEGGTPGADSSASGATASQSGSSESSAQTTSAPAGFANSDSSLGTAPQ